MKPHVAFAAVLACTVLPAALFGSAPARAQQAELARSRNCLACHKVDAKGLGPSFREIAARYGADAGAPSRLAKKVREGGTGSWGKNVMPANPQVSEGEAEALVKWILTTR
jgi:cytochrome c